MSLAPSHKCDLGNTAALRTGDPRRRTPLRVTRQQWRFDALHFLTKQTMRKEGKEGGWFSKISKDPEKVSANNTPLGPSIYESLFPARGAHLLCRPPRVLVKCRQSHVRSGGKLLQQKEQMQGSKDGDQDDWLPRRVGKKTKYSWSRVNGRVRGRVVWRTKEQSNHARPGKLLKMRWVLLCLIIV